MTPYDKAVELVRSFNPYVNFWTTISKPHETPQCVAEAGQRKGRAKQCALIAVDEILKIGDEQYYNWKFWEEVKKEIQEL